jgi:hypothetical protein
MVDESKDWGPQGFEGAHSEKLVVHRLFNHSDAKKCATDFRLIQTWNNKHLEISKKKLCHRTKSYQVQLL